MKTKDLQKCRCCPVVCDRKTMEKVPVLDKKTKELIEYYYYFPKHRKDDCDLIMRRRTGGTGSDGRNNEDCYRMVPDYRFIELERIEKQYWKERRNPKSSNWSGGEIFWAVVFFGFACYGIMSLIYSLVI